MKKTLLLTMGAMLLAGCSLASQHTATDALANRSFLLTSVDGQAITEHKGMRPGINFSKELRVTGVMCNRFMGQGKLDKGVLSVPNLASTRMMCSDPQLNRWEVTLARLLTSGAKVNKVKDTLTLEGAGHSLVYTAQ